MAQPDFSLTAPQRQTLRVLMDTFVPPLPRGEDPHGFFGLSASRAGMVQAAETYLGLVSQAEQAGLSELLSKLAFVGKMEKLPLAARERTLDLLAREPRAKEGLGALRRLTLLLTYAQPDQQGQNPFWKQFGYAGATFVGAKTTPDLTLTEPEGGAELHADVVVVGSGAGGGVIAGELAAAGQRVIVLEMGQHHPDAELGRSELWAYKNLYWCGGFTATDDGNVQLIAGKTVGGGTTVNWMNCVQPPAEVRREWAEAGLDGLDSAEFQADLDAVSRRIQANTECSEWNGTHQRMIEGAMRLGYHFKRAARNADPALHDPQHAGHCGFGDATGSKQSTAKTYLLDAQGHGAAIIGGATAQRILVEDGKARGIEAVYAAPDGTQRPFSVTAPRVVVAGGALETPALLLRSGIGGPAVGNYLRLHPCGALAALFDHDQENWWGATQAAIVDEFEGRKDGYGFLIETTQFTTGLYAAATPWHGARDHRERTAQLAKAVTLIHLTRDHGHGQVTLRPDGTPYITYPLTDAVDVENYRAGLAAVARILAAASAHTIFPLSEQGAAWHSGQDLEAAIAAWQAQPIGKGGNPIFSAHQMGSARMGLDPKTSVAKPSGELHDVSGVWIGDTSAFPTSSGANPMLTCMALARRTARKMLEQAKQ